MSYNGRIPVPGCVTSVRTSTREERLHAQRKKQEEVEREKKRRLEEEEAARILAQQWAKEDRERANRPQRRGDEGGVADRPRRRRGEEGQASEDGRDDGPKHYGSRSDVPTRGPAEGDRRGEREKRYEEPAAGRHDGEDSEAQRSRSRSRDRRTRSVPAEVTRLEPCSTQASGVPHHSGAPQQEPPRPAEEEGGVWHTVTKGKCLEPPRDSIVRSSSQKLSQPSKLAGVFGVGDSDDEMENARSEMQLAANAKRAAPAHASRAAAAPRVGDAHEEHGIGSGGGADEGLAMEAEVQREVCDDARGTSTRGGRCVRPFDGPLSGVRTASSRSDLEQV
eukprot:CAMPEP_0117510958 /NCGR_PEP_ID=MMETSP0784-20121206/28259_1 /TAXON_ID=39447 /ORGANISM="" /LENGTH=334 /DNA_ID=CAMNT_0005306613 /DNA_START=1 /DNA_END=1001 /DNA_ORIENTATION=+